MVKLLSRLRDLGDLVAGRQGDPHRGTALTVHHCHQPKSALRCMVPSYASVDDIADVLNVHNSLQFESGEWCL